MLHNVDVWAHGTVMLLVGTCMSHVCHMMSCDRCWQMEQFWTASRPWGRTTQVCECRVIRPYRKFALDLDPNISVYLPPTHTHTHTPLPRLWPETAVHWIRGQPGYCHCSLDPGASQTQSIARYGFACDVQSRDCHMTILFPIVVNERSFHGLFWLWESEENPRHC